MISKGQIKLIRSLQQKKYRKQYNLFLVEGVKLINELVFSEYKIHSIFASTDRDLRQYIDNEYPPDIREKIGYISENILQSISNLVTANKLIAIVEMPPERKILPESDINLVLDGIRDPGNLGTLFRIADWFGLSQVICSVDCADIYNHKTVQASMGSLFRVNVVFTDLFEYLKKSKNQVYATVLNGQSIHDTKFKAPADIVIGNESEGIRFGLDKLACQRISIPRYGKAESLNAAIAGAVVLDWARNSIS